MTGTGMAVFVIMGVLNYFHIIASTDQVTMLVNNIISISSFVMMIVGQISRQDLKLGLVRK
jgi:hypothetical protein